MRKERERRIRSWLPVRVLPRHASLFSLNLFSFLSLCCTPLCSLTLYRSLYLNVALSHSTPLSLSLTLIRYLSLFIPDFLHRVVSLPLDLSISLSLCLSHNHPQSTKACVSLFSESLFLSLSLSHTSLLSYPLSLTLS